MKPNRSEGPDAHRGTPVHVLRRVSDALATLDGVLGLVGAVVLVLGGVISLFLPELHSTGTVLMALGGAVGLAALLDVVRRARTEVARRQRRYAVNTAIMMVAFIGILGLVNLLVLRSDASVDLTATRQFSLAPQTLGVLKNLDHNVSVTAFFQEQQVGSNPSQAALRQRTEDLLHEFQRQSGSKVQYRFLDPDLEPVRASKLGVTRFPVVVFDGNPSGIRYQVQPSANPEQSFVTALLVSTGVRQKQVHVLTGHQERDLSDTEQGSAQGFGFAAQGLTGDNYLVLSLNLLQQGSVPDDAAVVVVPGPRQNLQLDEAIMLNAYLSSGGRVMLLLDPESPQSWRDLAGRWGVELTGGYVIDVGSGVAGLPATPLVNGSQYLSPLVTQGLGSSFFPGLTPLDLVRDPTDMPNVVGVDPLARTSYASFATADPSQTTPAATDLIGPFLVGVVVWAVAPVDDPTPVNPSAIAALAVIGDSDFVSNQNYYGASNSDLFLDTVDYLAGDLALISVRAKPMDFRQLVLTEAQFNRIRYAIWLVLPLLVALAGVAVWWRRR